MKYAVGSDSEEHLLYMRNTTQHLHWGNMCGERGRWGKREMGLSEGREEKEGEGGGKEREGEM